MSNFKYFDHNYNEIDESAYNPNAPSEIAHKKYYVGEEGQYDLDTLFGHHDPMSGYMNHFAGNYVENEDWAKDAARAWNQDWGDSRFKNIGRTENWIGGNPALDMEGAWINGDDKFRNGFTFRMGSDLAKAQDVVSRLGGTISKGYMDNVVRGLPLAGMESNMEQLIDSREDPGWGYNWNAPSYQAAKDAGYLDDPSFADKYGMQIALMLMTMGVGAGMAGLLPGTTAMGAAAGGGMGAAGLGGLELGAAELGAGALEMGAADFAMADLAGGLIPEFGTNAAYTAGLGDLATYGAGMEAGSLGAASGIDSGFLSNFNMTDLATDAAKRAGTKVVTNVASGQDPFEGIGGSLIGAGLGAGFDALGGTAAIDSLGLPGNMTPAIRGGVLSTLNGVAQGQDFGDALTRGVTGGVAGVAGAGVGSALQGSGIDPLIANIASGAVRGGVGATLNGGNAGVAALNGGISGAANGAVNKLTGAGPQRNPQESAAPKIYTYKDFISSRGML